MGMGMTTTSTTVTISGAVTTSGVFPSPSASQTVVQKAFPSDATTTTYATKYTVTAGKTLYITSITFLPAASARGISFADAGTEQYVAGQAGGMSGIPTILNFVFPTPLKFVTTVQVKTYDLNSTNTYSFSGWEE